MGAIIVISAFRVKDFGGGEDDERAWPVPIHQVFFEDGNQTEINHQHNGVVFKVIWVSKGGTTPLGMGEWGHTLSQILELSTTPTPLNSYPWSTSWSPESFT